MGKLFRHPAGIFYTMSIGGKMGAVDGLSYGLKWLLVETSPFLSRGQMIEARQGLTCKNFPFFK